MSRLNGVIRALETGGHAFSLFAPCEIETATELQTSPYDSVVFEGEHRGWDIKSLRNSLQYLMNRGQIAKDGLAPAVTPLARVPANGCEMNQFLAKQALDIGCYGIVFPHISTVEEAYNAIAACRYPRLKGKPLYEPAGIRGDGPMQAARYWGLSMAEYYAKADVWPLAAEGEIFAVLQIEDIAGVTNLPDMLKNVPGIGAVLIGEGDLSQELGVPRQTEHPEVVAAMAQVVATCKEHNVIVGHPHVTKANAQRVIDEGYRFLMAAAPRSFDTVNTVRAQVGG
ncbi:HpcH/HpaI aldolase family protein [Paraburkholderia fynbosensis]|uniref:5-keto-4-deoxy-D-glucarate aldolase n=1 Tax=Paraburkholderia fynbosensis TaxID=1200993 RepID=A0A6J5FDN5_9BURK|nr:aldolase/citrate lyase family protein [Paraburkholderia fynbosensis]CAB3777364.1 5-keto-4-deoxy-D-glucarate aldolase [Paraburkholderia fynbosensis]